jgi:hypothetical protein
VNCPKAALCQVIIISKQHSRFLAFLLSQQCLRIDSKKVADMRQSVHLPVNKVFFFRIVCLYFYEKRKISSLSAQKMTRLTLLLTFFCRCCVAEEEVDKQKFSYRKQK